MFKTLQDFWDGSGDFWQSRWDNVLQFFDYNEFNICFYGTCLVTFSVFWIFGTFYTIIDLTGRPAFLLRYKLQDLNSQYPVSWSHIWRAIRQVLINQFFFQIPFIFIGHSVMKWRGYDWIKLPTFQWFILELSVYLLIEEFCLYYVHRLLHTPLLFKYIHRRHHEWMTTIAIIGIYCHPIEHIFNNIFPLFLGIQMYSKLILLICLSGPFVFGSHMATAWLWYTIASIFTLHTHSGFHFPFFLSPEAHVYHHLKFNQNFGLLGVLDRLHGTDAMFRKTKAFERRVKFFSIVPIKEQYSDQSKKPSLEESRSCFNMK